MQRTKLDPLDLVGTHVDGKYQIDAMIDQTNHSIVYRATHLIWKRHVAIKVFRPASPVEAEERDAMIARFVREGALLTELSETCSAICQARDIGSLTTPAGAWMPYLVLEWLDGESLDVLLAQERESGAPARTLQEVLRLLDPIADALGCAHGRGVVHCDVKPGNIILLRTGARQSKLFDFGIAKVVGDGPSRSAILDHGFTPGFAAPEQFDSSYGETGPWTDVFALALLVVEMVSGQEALQGREVVTLGQASCDRHRRPTPRALGIHVGDEVERVLSRALAVDPGRRFADVRPFWNELTSAASLPAKGTTTPFVLLSARPGPVALLVAQPARSPRARGRGHGRAGRKWLPVALVSAMSLAIALIPTHHRAAPRRAAGQQAARASVLAGSLAVDGPTVPERLP